MKILIISHLPYPAGMALTKRMHLYTKGLKGKLNYKDFEDILNWVASQEDIEVLIINKTTELSLDLGLERYLNKVV